jgi:hypothetical protein
MYWYESRKKFTAVGGKKVYPTTEYPIESSA